MSNLRYNLSGDFMLVKNIKFINNKIEVVMENRSFFMSKENYIENPITIDSEIDDDKIECLLEYEKVIECKSYLIKILNKRVLSEYEVVLKLKEREISDNHIKDIVESLRRMGLINDEFAAVINVERELLKRKGRKAIIKVLKEKGIKEKIIDKSIGEIDEEIYLSNFNKMAEKYIKMYDKRSCRVKENMVKDKLAELGYEETLICGVIVSQNREKELELAKCALGKIMKNKKLDLTSYESVNKIKVKLAIKGFSYDIINLVLEGVKNDEVD